MPPVPMPAPPPPPEPAPPEPSGPRWAVWLTLGIGALLGVATISAALLSGGSSDVKFRSVAGSVIPSASPTESLSPPPGCPAPAAGSPASWHFHTDELGEYSIALPSDTPTTTSEGLSHRLLVETNGMALTVDWYVAPATRSDRVLYQQTRRYLKVLPDKARRIRVRTVHVGGLTEKRITYWVSEPFSKNYARLLVSQGRIYYVGVATGSLHGMEPEIRAFFSSFTPLDLCSLEEQG